MWASSIDIYKAFNIQRNISRKISEENKDIKNIIYFRRRVGRLVDFFYKSSEGNYILYIYNTYVCFLYHVTRDIKLDWYIDRQIISNRRRLCVIIDV